MTDPVVAVVVKDHLRKDHRSEVQKCDRRSTKKELLIGWHVKFGKETNQSRVWRINYNRIQSLNDCLLG